jgi:hypothetical protein
MAIADRRLAGRQQRVLGDRDTAIHDHDIPVAGLNGDVLADEAVRDRIARRSEPHGRQPVDLALFAARHRRSSGGQGPQ